MKGIAAIGLGLLAVLPSYADVLTFTETYTDKVVQSRDGGTVTTDVVPTSAMNANISLTAPALAAGGLDEAGELGVQLGEYLFVAPVSSATTVNPNSVVFVERGADNREAGRVTFARRGNAINVTINYRDLLLTERSPIEAGNLLDAEPGNVSGSVPLTISVGGAQISRPVFYTGKVGVTSRVVNEEDVLLYNVQLKGLGDTVKPVVVVTTPKANSRVFEPIIDVAGRITENLELSSMSLVVSNSAGASEPIPVEFTSEKDWVAFEVPLAEGTNFLHVVATDSSGNVNAPSVTRVIYVVMEELALGIAPENGGKVAGVNLTQPLEVGKRYTLTATPSKGFLFAGWTTNGVPVGGTLNPKLNFAMTRGMEIEADFIENPFPTTAANFAGLFRPTEDIQITSSNSGTINITLSPKGVATGKIMLEGKPLSFTAPVNPVDFTAFTTIKRGSKLAPVDLELEFVDGGAIGSVILPGPEGPVPSPIEAYQTEKLSTWTGNYTFLITPPQNSDRPTPVGYGAGTITVDRNGLARVNGNLADGTPMTVSANLVENVGEDGTISAFFPLYLSLQKGKGLLIGYVHLVPDPGAEVISDTLVWLRTPDPKDKFFPDGFFVPVLMDGAKYTPPARGESLTGWTYGLLTMVGGDLGEGFTIPVVYTNNQFRVENNAVKITINNANGLISASFKHPDTGRSTVAKGALIRDETESFGYGWFLGSTEPGGFILEPGEAPAPEEPPVEEPPAQ